MEDPLLSGTDTKKKHGGWQKSLVWGEIKQQLHLAGRSSPATSCFTSSS